MSDSDASARTSSTELVAERDEALALSAAMADVLQVINSASGNPTPVLEAILAHAMRLCDAAFGMLNTYDNKKFKTAAVQGLPDKFADFRRSDPPDYAPGTPPARLVAGEPFVHVPDITAETPYLENEPNLRAIAELGGARTVLAVPLLEKANLAGMFAIYRQQVRPFTKRQIAVLQSFAAQAALALQNARLFNETQEALQRQTATAEVLKVISRSAFDLQSVLDTLVESACRLCEAYDGVLLLRQGDYLSIAAHHGDIPVVNKWPVSRDWVSGRCVVDRKPIHIHDLSLEEAEFPRAHAFAQQAGHRSLFAVPLMRENEAIGAINIRRNEVRPFSEKQIELLQTFANQAVIAIENVRLFDEVQARTRELAESLQQQTATADVLKVISRSAFDLDSVMNALTQSASELCRAELSGLYLREGNVLALRGVAAHLDPAQIDFLRRTPLRIDGSTYISRTFQAGVVRNVGDVASETEMGQLKRFGETLGFKSILFVPLLREGRSVGIFALGRARTGEFSQREVELVQTFADQAVIAVENVRLFDEVQAKTRDLEQALTYQTGSANILKVIASTPTDAIPALQAIVESACELCDAYDCVMVLKDGADLRFSAHHGPIPMSAEKWPINRRWTAGRAFVDQKPVHVHDLLAEGEEFPDGRELSKRMGHRTILSVPLLREGESVGAMVLRRTEVLPFTEKQISLLQTFADQAVIAIGNVRLFEEVQAKTRDLSEALKQQTATADVLKVISRSAFDLQPVLDTLVKSATQLCEAEEGIILQPTGEGFGLVADWGLTSDKREFLQSIVFRPADGRLTGRVLSQGRVVHIHDVLDEPEFIVGGDPDPARTRLGVPLLRDSVPIGVFVLTRQEVRPFTDRQVELVQTFAAQAVIAIENARLFNETKEALERQTATADILKVIASSPDDVQPVFDAIAERSNRIVDGRSTAVYSLVAGFLHLMAFTPTSPEADAALRTMFPRPLSRFRWAEAINSGKVYQTADMQDPLFSNPEGRELAKKRGFRSMMAVPLISEQKIIGVISVTRVVPGMFPEHHVQLLRTFADQAVIAISNVELFQEVQQRTRDLSQSLDDLRTAQDRLVQTEKLASLGQLTAGIAHEIKNPLNFVNNFSSLSAELTSELNDLLKDAALTDKMRTEVEELTRLLRDNLEKIVQHGKRADSIVKNMLLHSREGSGEQRAADINALVDESLNLAYHGARAEKSGFNITLKRDFDAKAGSVELFPQEITRALLNLISNGFYAATKRQKDTGGEDFEPVLAAATRNIGGAVEIRIRDNGMGIPPEVREKMFNPFFTTKPAGEGTGLGLSMTHDIVVKQHGGKIDVATEPGQFTEFTIVLPRSGPKQ